MLGSSANVPRGKTASNSPRAANRPTRIIQLTITVSSSRRAHPIDSTRMLAPEPPMAELREFIDNTERKYSTTTTIATPLEAFNRALETFLTCLSRINEYNEKSKECPRNQDVTRMSRTVALTFG